VRVVAVLALLFALAFPVFAQRPQLKRPEPDTPRENIPVPKKKKEGKDPRAVALLQIAANGKATLIPIAILIDGKFYDASAYKADPVPMALDTGTVYEAEQSGASQGLFTVNGALHSKNPNAPVLWFGTGSYVLNGTEVAKTTHRAEDQPRGLDNSDDAPPRLTRTNTSQSSPPAPGKAEPGASPASAGGASDKTSAAPPATTSQPASSSSSAGTSSSNPLKAAADAPSPATQNQPNQNYYKPTLRRGKPTEPMPDDVDDSLKATASTSTAVATPAAGAVSAKAPPVKLLPAISDAGGPEPQSYKFFWKEGEEDDRRTQMLALAQFEVRNYVAALARNRIPAKQPPKSPVTARKTKTKPVQPILENVEFHSFGLWKNNQPVMILTAEAHFPPTPGATEAPETYNIALAATTDIYGDLRKLYVGVTDKFHLDVTPRLELIDAVDADGDGRGELLFRETTDAGDGYIIYRATPDKLWKMFDSLAE